METADIVIIGAGAAGLMAALGAGARAERSGAGAQAGAVRVVALEKMPRPGRKIMITGKGRCNFTNVKEWEDFSQHIHPKANLLRPAFYNLPPQKVIEMMESLGVECVVERGDRAFPASHQAADIVDALVKGARRAGAEILCNKAVVFIMPDAATDQAAADIAADGATNQVAAGSAADNAANRAPAGTAADNAAAVAQGQGFTVLCHDGSEYRCKKLIITTGGLSYPTTGSTGDGLSWAAGLGLEVRPTFPSLTAIVPKNYKSIGSSDGKNIVEIDRKYAGVYRKNAESDSGEDARLKGQAEPARMKGHIDSSTPLSETGMAQLKGHIDRSTPLSETGMALMGCSLKNVGVSVAIDGNTVQQEFGDIDFTDGGIEGPIGFKVSRKCVNAIINGSKVSVILDLKPAVETVSLEMRIATLWKEISDGDNGGSRGNSRSNDFRSGRGADSRGGGNARNAGGRSYSDRFRILLRKLLPQELIPGFLRCNPDVDHKRLAKVLKNWKFDIAGFVGYERCVVTAGGVSTSEITPKTLASKKVPGLYLAGEILDLDGDTGGYNLQTAFSTGYLAGLSAAQAAGRDTNLSAD